MYQVAKLNALKHHVVKAGVGTVFISKNEKDCQQYVREQEAKEKGLKQAA